MGRYFLFHMHQFSVGELLGTTPPSAPVHPPGRLSNEEWKALWEHGGYPEPFVRRDRRFSLRWRELRRVQLLREEVRDLTRIQELDQIAVLGRLLERRSGGQLVYSPLAREVDFLVIRDGEPWFLVEVKHRDKNLSPDLVYFQKQIGCPHAFQIVTDSGFVEQDCFSYGSPVVVPARTFFSQLP